ncbi:hypothetical protein [Gordonia humi]|uniref:Uncharacterized protein n=1 Tax=Gordonia humi TaxID=686429 RepID=A0A840EWY9_9ACTN|nr:hypothetical protein [Gordonia humi]MBB4137515.1 hypothetical protein [Gordonia humi]
MTVYADVSEWQTPITDAYPHRLVAIRSNDGDYRDKNWATNHAWCRRAADAGRLDCFIVYVVYRSNWQDVLSTLKAQVGTPHRKMIVMVDVESWGGQITGDHSTLINHLVDGVTAWLGDRRRVIAYGNRGDLANLYPQRPAGLRLVVAAYSSNRPSVPGQISWQYTDGQGYGPAGWPQGAPPWARCDMNSTTLTSDQFAAQCGVTTGGTMSDFDDARDARAQLVGSTQPGQYPGWPQLGGRTVVDALAAIGEKLGIDGFKEPKQEDTD